jgi:hypothetical protein
MIRLRLITLVLRFNDHTFLAHVVGGNVILGLLATIGKSQLVILGDPRTENLILPVDAPPFRSDRIASLRLRNQYL